MKQVTYLLIFGALLSLVTTPVVAQTPTEFVLPLPPSDGPAAGEIPVDAARVPTVPISSSTQDLSFTLVPPDPAIAPVTPGLPRPNVALNLATQARVTNLAANVSTRLDMLTQRYEQIAQRLKARIEIEKAAGRDTTTAEAAWGEAATTLINVKLLLAPIDDQVQDTVSSSDSYTAWGGLKNSYFGISAQLRQVHQNLLTGVEALR